MNTSKKYSREVRERAVRLVIEHQGEHESEMGGDRFDSEQDWLHGRDLAQMGAPGRARSRAAWRFDQYGAGKGQRAGAGKP